MRTPKRNALSSAEKSEAINLKGMSITVLITKNTGLRREYIYENDNENEKVNERLLLLFTIF
jgi:hypothetical protein